MDWLDADGYWLARWIVQRGVAAVYLVAFVNILAQWRPLLGERGLTPAAEVAAAADRWLPTLFRHGVSDRHAIVVAWIGAGVSTTLVLGVPQAGPWWLPLIAFAVLWVLYLSYVTIGRVWYAFGWETLLLEAGVLAAFLGSDAVAPPWLVLLLIRWLVFRVEFGAGLIKLRGDACWRDFTCLEYHHETQPLPNRMSWWFHHLPRPLHRVEVAANHLTQLVMPFGLFAPQPVAGIAGATIIATQAWLVLSGNFSWLNTVTMVLAVTALPDPWLSWVPVDPPVSVAPAPTGYVLLVVALTVMVIALSLRGPVRNLFSPRQRMNTSHDPLRLVNSYGAFGSITRVRYELVIEATADAEPLAKDATWQAYEFRAKPGDPARAPRQVAPYHLRLDWLMWFAAMDAVPTGHVWFQRLLSRLLAADPTVLRLLAHDPLDGGRPTAVRVLRYRYRFTTLQQRHQTGAWWMRDRRRLVVGPVLADAPSSSRR